MLLVWCVCYCVWVSMPVVGFVVWFWVCRFANLCLVAVVLLRVWWCLLSVVGLGGVFVYSYCGWV